MFCDSQVNCVLPDRKPKGKEGSVMAGYNVLGLIENLEISSVCDGWVNCAWPNRKPRGKRCFVMVR